MTENKNPADNEQIIKPTLVLYSHQNNRIIEEDFKNIENSVFLDEYKDALKICREIITNFEGTLSEGKNKYNHWGNNIISIIGGKGVGKSSFMVSFAELLCLSGNDDYKKTYDTLTKNENFGFPNDYYLTRLKRIDPTLLEDRENLFDYIVGSMFKELKKWCKRTQRTSPLLIAK